jgi:hypothetical protein
MVWVATVAGGIYVAADVVDPPITQPTWAARNNGLPSLECLEFHIDPFAPSEIQYVVINGYGIYRREGGAWESILSFDDCNTLFGQPTTEIFSVYPDPTVAGRIWAKVGTYANWIGYRYAIYSNDYGNTWNLTTCVESTGQMYDDPPSLLRACGENAWVHISCRANSWTGGRLYYSSNRGSSWSDCLGDDDGGYFHHLNPLYTSKVYCKAAEHLYTQNNAGSMVKLIENIHPDRFDAMWFHATNPVRQRMIHGDKLYSTSDQWSTINSPSSISPAPISLCPVVSSNEDFIIVGTNASASVGCIAVMEGEDDVDPVNISGSMFDTPPYTDSIPYTAGNACQSGIQAIFES